MTQFKTLLLVATTAFVAATPAMAQDTDSADTFNGPYISGVCRSHVTAK